jgi:hypothetical protein
MKRSRELEQEYEAARFAGYSNVSPAVEFVVLEIRTRRSPVAHCQVLPTDRRAPGAYIRSQ